MTQNMENTLKIYENFQHLAKYINEQGTEQDAMAMQDAIQPLVDAIAKKLNIPPGSRIVIDWNEPNKRGTVS